MTDRSSTHPHHPEASDAFVQRGTEMDLIEHDLVRSRMRDLQIQADTHARARRLLAARRWARRAERATRRAARASAAVR
ncbi:hypothetical protein [Modestobacter lapidis]|nr:hypothetical protein [Modestobacter lapidis]